jgi:uncharacterized membrane protein HdeD (DUF308 family)
MLEVCPHERGGPSVVSEPRRSHVTQRLLERGLSVVAIVCGAAALFHDQLSDLDVLLVIGVGLIAAGVALLLRAR